MSGPIAAHICKVKVRTFTILRLESSQSRAKYSPDTYSLQQSNYDAIVENPLLLIPFNSATGSSGYRNDPVISEMVALEGPPLRPELTGTMTWGFL